MVKMTSFHKAVSFMRVWVMKVMVIFWVKVTMLYHVRRRPERYEY